MDVGTVLAKPELDDTAQAPMACTCSTYLTTWCLLPCECDWLGGVTKLDHFKNKGFRERNPFYDLLTGDW